MTAESAWPTQWKHRIFTCRSCDYAARAARRISNPQVAESDLERKRRWKAANREKIREQGRRYRERNRAAILAQRAAADPVPRRLTRAEWAAQLKLEVMAHYGAAGQACCVGCGFTDLRALSIDHIEGSGSRHRKEIGGGGSRMYQWLKAQDWPSGYQTLCMNCQMIKRMERGEHGRYAAAG